TDEAGHPGGVADGPPDVVVQVATDQQIAGEGLLLDGDLLAALELDDVLHGDDDLEHLVLHPPGGHHVLQVRADLVIVAGVGVDDVPPPGAVVGAGDVDVLQVVVVQVVLLGVGVGAGLAAGAGVVGVGLAGGVIGGRVVLAEAGVDPGGDVIGRVAGRGGLVGRGVVVVGLGGVVETH